MYASRTVCSRCAASRMRLVVSPTNRNGTVAWFSSPATDDDSAAFGRDMTDAQQRTHRGSYKRSFPSAHNPANVAPFRRPNKNHMGQSSAVALFNDVVQRSVASGNDPAASASVEGSANGCSTTDHAQGIAASALSEWEIATKMKKISDMDLQPGEKLRFFEKNVWPHIKELRCCMPKHVYLSTSVFLADICNAVAHEGVPGTSLTLSNMLGTIGKWDLDLRNQLVLNICHILITRKLSYPDRQALVDELVVMWKHLSQLMRPSQVHQPGEDPLYQFVLPAVDEIIDDITNASSFYKKGGRPSKQGSVSFSATTRALTSIFVQFRLEQATELIPGLLATLAVLSDVRRARDIPRIEAAPLLNLVSVALEHQPADESYIEDIFATSIRYPAAKVSEVQSYVVAQWPRVTKLLFSEDSTWRNVDQNRSSSHSQSLDDFLSRIHKLARAAYSTRIAGAIGSVWQELKDELAKRPDLADHLRLNRDLLDYWVFVWCAMQRPYKLQEVLELMQQLQVQPTVRTYTNMIHGWKIRKDWPRIEALWQKLVDSGIKLDVYIWTARISGLIEAGKPQAGIHALAEMQGLWAKAVANTGDAESAASIAVQPTIEVVNAALKGLINVDRQAANEVLAWAGREAIEPNVRTYNILLKESFRSTSSIGTEGVDALLQNMQAQGVEPDAATFTIILEKLLGGLEGTTAAEQVQAVEQILSDMRAAGLKPNRETYGKMLFAVSSLPFGGADAAVSAVQKYMRADGFSGTSQTVTILIERALSRDPLPANTGAEIRALLEKHQLHNIRQGDRTLWERVMSAYAFIGDVPAAMDLFNQLANAGRPVTSLPCLNDLLKALLHVHHHGYDNANSNSSNATAYSSQAALADAREVVRTVLNYKISSSAEEGIVDQEREARYWKHHFWFMAMENSLVDWNIVPPELERLLMKAE
ncbi:hypothetical protein E4U21_007700 [Claviceps maximensis]|nr:hypothetical protein E4U21_007700 [Claviceps maximensis]